MSTYGAVWIDLLGNCDGTDKIHQSSITAAPGENRVTGNHIKVLFGDKSAKSSPAAGRDQCDHLAFNACTVINNFVSRR